MLRRDFLSNAMLAPTLAKVPATSAPRDAKVGEADDVFDPGGPLSDYTDVLQAAIDRASHEKKGRLFIPRGTYPIRSLILRTGLVIEGAGRGATIFDSLPGTQEAFISIAPGPVLNSGLKALSLNGGTPAKSQNAGQWAVRLTSASAPTGKPHGGLWWFVFEEISINQFDCGIWFEGGQGDYLHPHQFGSFRDVVIYGNAEAQGPGLRMSGQVNQITFSQVHIDHHAKIGVEIVEAEDGKTSPKLHHFDMVTIQSAECGVTVAGAHNIAFSNCWFEQNGMAVAVRSRSYGISLQRNRFANSGKNGSVLQFEEDTSGSVRDNVFAGRSSAKAIGAGDSSKPETSNNSFIWGAEE